MPTDRASHPSHHHFSGIRRLSIFAAAASLFVVSGVGVALFFAQSAVARTPIDEPVMRWERSIDGTRTERLLSLATVLMPQCDLVPSEQDMTEFYAYWRYLVRQEIKERTASGWSFSNRDDDELRFQLKLIGLDTPRQYQLPELLHVGPEMPHANEVVAHQIKVWKALHCVTERYDGEKFFSISADANSGRWPFESILNTPEYHVIPIDTQKTKAYLLPNMLNLEPLDALGRFFRDAEKKGHLRFPNKDAENYFFMRYESGLNNMSDVAKARAWFHTAPWKPNALHLERPIRAITRHSRK